MKHALSLLGVWIVVHGVVTAIVWYYHINHGHPVPFEQAFGIAAAPSILIASFVHFILFPNKGRQNHYGAPGRDVPGEQEFFQQMSQNQQNHYGAG